MTFAIFLHSEASGCRRICEQRRIAVNFQIQSEIETHTTRNHLIRIISDTNNEIGKFSSHITPQNWTFLRPLKSDLLKLKQCSGWLVIIYYAVKFIAGRFAM